MSGSSALKYAQEIAKFPPCPPAKCSEKTREEAFRFVSKELLDEDFIPPYVKKPARMTTASPHICCEGHALSLYETEREARAKFAKLFAKNRNIAKAIGSDRHPADHLAVGSLAPTDGMQTLSNREGHFGLHEYSHCALEKRFTLVGKL